MGERHPSEGKICGTCGYCLIRVNHNPKYAGKTPTMGFCNGLPPRVGNQRVEVKLNARACSIYRPRAVNEDKNDQDD